MSQYAPVVDVADLDGTNGFSMFGIEPLDQIGYAVSSAGDVNHDGYDDFMLAGFSASINASFAGSTYVVFGHKGAFDSGFDLADLNGKNGFAFNGDNADDRSGIALSSAGDVNGDGFDDVIIGAEGADGGDANSGVSYVVFGKEHGFHASISASEINGHNGFAIAGVSSSEFAGKAVSSTGDINADGADDLIVSGRNGATYVVFGSTSAFDATVALADLDGSDGFKISSSSNSVSTAGDVNGDGIDDLVVGVPSSGAFSSGVSYIIFGKTSSFADVFDLASLDGANGFALEGSQLNSQTGFSVSGAGDINGDGFADIVVGAPYYASNGKCYVVFGTDAGFSATIGVGSLDGNNGFAITGASSTEKIGLSVASAGDFNGDGFDDLILGAAFQASHVYVVFGRADGFSANLGVGSVDGNNGFAILDLDGDNVGRSVDGAGDINGDGFDDLIVGASQDTTNGDHAGATYVVFGGMPAEAVTRIGTDIDNTIRGGDFADTLTGLGGDDALYGYGDGDVMSGGGGDDLLDGDGGADLLKGAGGADELVGGASGDKLTGGNGDDVLNGGFGADRVNGGAGSDVFIYAAAADSTSVTYDVTARFDAGADVFDTAFAVSAVDAAMTAGTLNSENFDADLTAAIGDLQAGHAVVFTPDAGSAAGKTFLVVDVNGTAGYQAFEDLVVRLAHATNLESFGTGNFI